MTIISTTDESSSPGVFRYLAQKSPLPPMAYVAREGRKAGAPQIVFVGGYMTSLNHKMVKSLEKLLCDQAGYPLIKFDYTHTGRSVYTAYQEPGRKEWKLTSPLENPDIVEGVRKQGKMAEGENPAPSPYDPMLRDKFIVTDPKEWSFLQWRKDVLTVLKHIAKQDAPVVLIGYDIGAWFALLAAMRAPHRIKAVVCLSAQFDCFLRLFEEMNCEHQGKCKRGDAVEIKHIYERTVNLTLQMVLESKEFHLLTMGTPLPVKCPVRFVHNLLDSCCPYGDVVELVKRFETRDVEVVTVKDGSHEMTGPGDLPVVYRALSSVLNDAELKEKAVRMGQLDHRAIRFLKRQRRRRRKPKFESDTETELSDVDNTVPKAKTRDMYEEVYRFPMYPRKPKEKESAQWDFVVEQELVDQRIQQQQQLDGTAVLARKQALIWMREGNARLDRSNVRYLYRPFPLPALAYVVTRRAPNASYRQPGVVYLSGFLNEMASMKAAKLERYFKDRGYAFVRFDYSDIGMSTMDNHPSRPPSPVDDSVDANEHRNKYKNWNFAQWRRDVLMVIDELTDGPQIVIGYGMGLWLALLAAIERPKLIKGVVGIAGAVDFFEHYLASFFNEQQRERIAMGETVWNDGPFGSYVGRRKMVDDSKPHQLLSREGKLSVSCPLRLCHSLSDEFSPYGQIEQLVSKLDQADVEVYYRKNGDHRMNTEKDYALIYKTIATLCALID